MEDNERGWYQKYVIGKTDGSPVDSDADYFILRLDKDEHAREAARTYALSVKDENPRLALDIIKRINMYN